MNRSSLPSHQLLLDKQSAGVLAPFGRLAMQPWFRWTALLACVLGYLVA